MSCLLIMHFFIICFKKTLWIQLAVQGGLKCMWCELYLLNLLLRYGNNIRNYIVRVGDYHTLVPEEFEEEIGVQQIVIHKEYRPESSDYDIALVRLQGPEEQCARFSTHVLPACLPLRRERPQKTAPNCYITGWGDTGKGMLNTLRFSFYPLTFGFVKSTLDNYFLYLTWNYETRFPHLNIDF